MMTKTYKTKASARRTAKKFGVEADSVYETEDGQWAVDLPEKEDEVEAAPSEEPETEVPVEEAETGAEEAEEKEKPEILRKSTVEGACALVWTLAGEMIPQGARRKDVIDKAMEQGVAFYTARTQYQKWLTASRESAATEVEEKGE